LGEKNIVKDIDAGFIATGKIGTVKMSLKHKKKYFNFLDSKHQMNYFGIGNLPIILLTKLIVHTTKQLLYLIKHF